MRKIIPAIVALLILNASLSLRAQHFAWTSTIVFTDIEYEQSAMCTARQELCVGGGAGELNYRDGDPAVYNGNGTAQLDDYELSYGGHFLFVYSFTGDLKWHYYFEDRSYASMNFTYDSENNLCVLVRRERDDDGYDNEEEEEEDDKDVSKTDAQKKYAEKYSGYCVLVFDTTGRIRHTVYIPELKPVVDVTDFEANPAGGFIIAGHADEGRFTTSLTLDAGKGGSDFILAVDKKGLLMWGDALSYQAESCCTYGADPQVCIAKDGTVYLAGSYQKGARFGGSVIKLAPVPYNAGAYYNAEEAYLASYSKEGKFLWVKTAGCQSRFTSLAIGPDNVYVACTAFKTGSLFGEKIDTSNHEHAFVTVFDPKGKCKSNISTGAGSYLNITTDAKGNLVVTGTIGIETGYLARPDSLKNKWRKDNTFIAFYSSSGKFQKCCLGSLLKIPSDEPPLCMAISSDEFFLAGKLWGTLSLPLHAIDKGFPDVKFSAGASFIGRWKQ